MKKVLIIEDDQDISEAVQLLLMTNGYTASIISKTFNLLKRISEEKADLIILDYLLSGEDGCNICKNLKKNPKTKKIPVIIISAHPSAKKAIIECGADGFLGKPFSITDLLAQVKKFIG